MSEPLPYRTAVVTGATSGIGRATVLKLRELGLTVYAVGRNEDKLQELAVLSGAKPIMADVRDTGEIFDQIAGVEVDILVNNAGILSTRASFHEIEPAEIDAMIDINLKAPMHLTRAFLPGMVERKRGHLIYLGSSGGQAPYPSMGAYGPSKAGLSLFCDNLRCDLLGTSVRVSEIVPGRVQTELYRTAIAGNQARELLYDGYRPIQPENIATIIANVITLPTFVDVSRIEVFPTDQATGGGTMVKYLP
ncbi:SDR family oxidoreductase [Agrobacterium vitis]|uniref:SDR family oxidoreductase n=1 Tax=Agrobacterium vitis TaxID=373 RepID=UPI0012E8D047|nr:SDR family oxidoreductase [Agrobacterium vitis]MUZ64981.1 SDR family NAD(P)-dependent oxidoreductase [Agrobacterium vitis]